VTAAAQADLNASPRARAVDRFAAYGVILALAAPLRIWAAVSDNGLFWPDEIYQSLEQAHRFAFGSGLIPWEFQQGARSWLFPGLIGLLWKLCHALGVRDALTFIEIAKLAVVVGGLCGIAAAMRLAERLAGLTAALLAGGLCATFPAMVVYGARCTTETVSGPLLVGAALMLVQPGGRRALWAAGMAGLAVFLRYQNGLITVGLGLWVLAQGQRRDASRYALGVVAVGLLGGALDWATWGAPFHAFAKYVDFNIVQNKAVGWGQAPFDYYARTAWTSTGPVLALVVLGLALAFSRARGLWLVAAAYVLAHCFVAHKEYRFLMPVWPLLLALAGVGLARIYSHLALPAWPAWLMVGALAATGFTGALAETFAQMGQYQGTAQGQGSVWHAGEDANLALLDAGQRPDLCGVFLAGVHPAWAGGYTYLGADVPFYFPQNARSLAGANYLVAPSGSQGAQGFEAVAEHGRFSVFRRDGGCAPPPPGWRPLLP